MENQDPPLLSEVLSPGGGGGRGGDAHLVWLLHPFLAGIPGPWTWVGSLQALWNREGLQEKSHLVQRLGVSAHVPERLWGHQGSWGSQNPSRSQPHRAGACCELLWMDASQNLTVPATWKQ